MHNRIVRNELPNSLGDTSTLAVTSALMRGKVQQRLLPDQTGP
jgi:hypothetical protein